MNALIKRVVSLLIFISLILALCAVPASAAELDSVGGLDGGLYLTIMCALVVVLIVVFLLALVFLGIVIMKTKKK